MSSYPGLYWKWCPPELTAAARPLLRTEEVLRKVSDDKRGVERLGERGPSAEVHEALRSFMERWDLALWKVSGTAGSLGDELRRCAEEYIGTEGDLSRKLALTWHDHKGWPG